MLQNPLLPAVGGLAAVLFVFIIYLMSPSPTGREYPAVAANTG